jgi:hypothetical protein
MRDRRNPLALTALVAGVLLLEACGQAGQPAGQSARSGSGSASQPAGSTSSSLSITTDRRQYRQGDTISVSVTNRLETPVFAPRGDACAVVTLWRQSGAEWVSADVCPKLEVTVTEIAAGQTLSGPLGPYPRPPTASSPIVIGPVEPHGGSQPISRLPSAKPEPSRVVPEGAIGAPFSAAISPIGPATYRLAVTFSPGDRDAPPETAYSEPFIVEPGG